MDPFADPYAHIRRTVMEQQPDLDADSPTIRGGAEHTYFGNGTTRSHASPTPPLGSATSSSNSHAYYTAEDDGPAHDERSPLSPGEGDDLATIGLAAMTSASPTPSGMETPTPTTAKPFYPYTTTSNYMLGPDPFGTPKSTRSRLSALSFDGDVDLVITPPSPVTPTGVS